MADPVIKIKRSAVAGKQPRVADLPLGELALNTYDGRLYVSKSTDSGVTTSIVNVSGIQISDEGSPVGYANTINFVGSAVTVISVSGGVGIVSITGGSGGSANATVAISTVAPSSPSAGDLWYNSILGRTFIYYNDGDSSQWVDSAPFNVPQEDSNPVLQPGKTGTSFVATEGQTTFSVSYAIGYVDVFMNGVRLNYSEFVENGSSITLVEPASAGDVIDVVEYRLGIGDTGPQGPAAVLTVATRAGVYSQNIAGAGITISLRSGIGTASF
jgi:hypothetical protein